MKGSREAVLRIENLALRFEGRSVLEGFCASVPQGGRVTLTGPSGSGKSSVLRCVMGFAVPASGSVFVRGERVTGHSIWKLRTQLAYVAQEPVLAAGTLREEFERPFGYAANHAARGNLQKLPALLERFLLARELLDRDVARLSGGERQRAAIISTLLLGRDIFLLDEPASALDVAAREAVLEFFRERTDLTVLAVSHAPQGFDLGGEVAQLPARWGAGGAA
jgi:ABC-type iron transport system FetAB ATPase subunit